jgi:hypothetical protein
MEQTFDLIYDLRKGSKFSSNLNFLGVRNLSLLKGTLPLRFGRLGEEVWKFCLQFFFSFPSGFFFYVMAPLHLARLNLLVSGDSFGRL